MKKTVCQLSAVCCPIALAFLTAVLISGCSEKKVAPGPNVLATVGKTEITIEDFNREIEWRKQNERSIPSKEALLAEMISRELSLQKARSLGLEKDAGLRRSWEEMLVGKLREQELGKAMTAIQVSDAEIRANYEQNIAKYTTPAKARLALIYMPVSRTTSDEKKSEIEARMSEALKLAKALPETSRGFDRVAIDFSEDQASRYKGGDCGWFDEGAAGYRWPQEVIQAGFALKNGMFSDVIKTPVGYFLVRKTDSRDAIVTPLEQAQNAIRQRLFSEKRQQAERAFAQQLQQFAPVQTQDDALAKLDYPKTTVAETKEPMPPALPRTQ